MSEISFNPAFPPLLTGHPVLPPLDAFDTAVEVATIGQAGAGDLFWSCASEDVSFAIVLEPEVDRGRAQEMLFALMVSAADAIGALCPPELAITWDWPDRINANGARLGAARMTLSPGDDDAGQPEWLVIGLNLQLQPRDGVDPGRSPDQTTLWDEGAGDLEAILVLESLSRHFLTWVHRWDTDGFKPIHDAWLFRCDGYRKDVVTDIAGQRVEGTFAGLDETGNLLLKRTDGTGETSALAVPDHLSVPVRAIAANKDTS